MTYDTNEYIFPKVLVLKTLIIETETFSPQYNTNTLLVSLHPFIYFEVKRRKMMTSVGIFTERASLGCSHQPSPS